MKMLKKNLDNIIKHIKDKIRYYNIKLATILVTKSCSLLIMLLIYIVFIKASNVAYCCWILEPEECNVNPYNEQQLAIITQRWRCSPYNEEIHQIETPYSLHYREYNLQRESYEKQLREYLESNCFLGETFTNHSGLNSLEDITLNFPDVDAERWNRQGPYQKTIAFVEILIDVLEEDDLQSNPETKFLYNIRGFIARDWNTYRYNLHNGFDLHA